VLLLRLAWRNVWRNGRRAAIVITAVAVGIAGVILSMAVNYGMVFQMVETAISTELGHLQLHARGFEDDPGLDHRLPDGGRPEIRILDGLPEVRAWAPRVRSQGLLSSARASAGVRVLGIDPAREAQVTDLAASMVAGAYLDGAAADRRHVLLGEALAQRLQVGIGDKVVLSATDTSGDLAGESFRVAGLFRTASLELDRSTVYLRLDESQTLFALGSAISELVAVVRDREAVPTVEAALRARLPTGVVVQSWEELAPLLVYLVDVFDEMAWIVYAAVFVAMAFGIANVLLMAVYERTREIGVVRAIGMSGRRVVGTVVLESLFLTFVGVVLGFALTAAALFALRDGIDLSRFAKGLTSLGVGTTVVPVVRPADFLTPSWVALATAVGSSLWPALRAARARPAEALRHV
jgi:ABC-type lipoprotein release transport system permease subunit